MKVAGLLVAEVKMAMPQFKCKVMVFQSRIENDGKSRKY